MLDTGSNKTLTYDLEDFYTYHLDHPDTAYIYKDYSRNRVVILGHGEVIVIAALSGQDGKIYLFMTTGYYTPRGYGKLFSI